MSFIAYGSNIIGMTRKWMGDFSIDPVLVSFIMEVATITTIEYVILSNWVGKWCTHLHPGIYN